MGGVLTTLQGLTFLVFQTDPCKDKGCTFSRGAGLIVAAILAFFLAGICFLFTSDYPGDLAHPITVLVILVILVFFVNHRHLS
jgi:hypothetical protein